MIREGKKPELVDEVEEKVTLDVQTPWTIVAMASKSSSPGWEGVSEAVSERAERAKGHVGET